VTIDLIADIKGYAERHGLTVDEAKVLILRDAEEAWAHLYQENSTARDVRAKEADDTWLVIGWGRWGKGSSLDEAKQNFRQQGGRLMDKPTILRFGEGSIFGGVDNMGNYYYYGEPPETVKR
jgi:hypothetical protein